MSESQSFLPIVNERQYNLLISLATTFLRENLANLANLANCSLSDPVNFDSDTARICANEITTLKDLLARLDNLDKRTHVKCASTWPIRIALPNSALTAIRLRLITIHQRHQSFAGKPDAIPAIEWWDKAADVHPNDHIDLMVLIGSLEAIDAQIPSMFKGMTIMTGLGE